MKNSRIYTSLITFILLIGLIGCSSIDSNTPGKKVIALYETLKNKDFEKTASFYVKKDGEKLSESEAKKVEGLMGMAAGEFEKKGGLDNITINEENISEDGTTAKVKFTIHYKNGDTKNESTNLIKVDNTWFFKISG